MQNKLLIGEPFERADRKIHRELAPVFALERDCHARRLCPAIRQTVRPSAFERTPIKP